MYYIITINNNVKYSSHAFIKVLFLLLQRGIVLQIFSIVFIVGATIAV